MDSYFELFLGKRIAKHTPSPHLLFFDIVTWKHGLIVLIPIFHTGKADYSIY